MGDLLRSDIKRRTRFIHSRLGEFSRDQDQGLWPLFHSSMKGSGGNRAFFDNEE